MRAPVVGFKLKPAGTEGAADHEVAGEPDTSVKPRENDEPAVPVKLEVGAIAGASVAVVMLRLTAAALDCPRAFVAVTTKLATPGEVGVPVMAPVVVLSERPAGNEPPVIE